MGTNYITFQWNKSTASLDYVDPLIGTEGDGSNPCAYELTMDQLRELVEARVASWCGIY